MQGDNRPTCWFRNIPTLAQNGAREPVLAPPRVSDEPRGIGRGLDSSSPSLHRMVGTRLNAVAEDGHDEPYSGLLPIDKPNTRGTPTDGIRRACG